MKLTYNVTDASQPVDIFCTQNLGIGMSFDIANVTDMVVVEGGSRAAGEPQAVTPAYQYTFSITGNHTIYVKFADMTVPELAFAMCTTLVDFELPQTINEIGGVAFAFTGLAGELLIPEQVTNIGELAFASF